MEVKEKQTLKELVLSIGFPKLIAIVLAGVVLVALSLPTGKSEKEDTDGTEETEALAGTELLAMYEYVKKQEEETEALLSEVEGIGKVKVMLTLVSSEEKITLQDEDSTRDGTAQENVIVEQDGNQSPYVVQVQSPVIEGVVVVAQGADSSYIQTEITEAIQALFPIEAHKIKVMSME